MNPLLTPAYTDDVRWGGFVNEQTFQKRGEALEPLPEFFRI